MSYHDLGPGPSQADTVIAALVGERKPKVHRFDGLTSGEVYDRTQCDDAIVDGDVLVIPKNATESHGGLVGIMVSAWPVVVHGGDLDGLSHKLHSLDHPSDWYELDGGKYVPSLDLAMETSA